MAVVRRLDEEECVKLCSSCGSGFRLPGKRSVWCRDCKNQWQRDYRAGVRRFEAVPPPKRDAKGCLIWQGYKMDAGYGHCTYQGRSTYAHIVAWVKEKGPIPPWLTIDHTCVEPACMDTSHMELRTRAENTHLAWVRRRGY